MERGQGLVVIEAMKMQNEMKSPKQGHVVSLTAIEGAAVRRRDVLVQWNRAMPTEACPKCGGSTWIVMEREGITGAERCECFGVRRNREREGKAGIPRTTPTRL